MRCGAAVAGCSSIFREGVAVCGLLAWVLGLSVDFTNCFAPLAFTKTNRVMEALEFETPYPLIEQLVHRHYQSHRLIAQMLSTPEAGRFSVAAV